MRRDLLKAGGAVALVRLLGMLAGFALTVTLARMLGAEGLGLYGFVLIVLSLATVPVSYGWATLLLRSVSAAAATGDWAEARGIQRAASVMAVAVAVLAAGAALGVALMRPEDWLTPALAVLLSVVLLCDQFSALRLAALRGLGHPVLGQLPEALLRPGLVLAGFLALAWIAGAADVMQAFVALLGASVAGMAIGTFILVRTAPSTLLAASPARTYWRWTKTATLLGANSGLVILMAQIDFLVLGLLAGAEDLGHYRVAMQVALVSGFAYVALNMIAAQRFAFLFAAGDMAGLQSAATFLARVAFAMTLPLPILFWFYGQPILTFVFGSGFDEAWAATLLLLSAQSVSAACEFNRSLLVMGGAEAVLLPVTLASIAVCVSGAVLFFPFMGIAGVALAALIGQLACNLSLTVSARRRFGQDTSFIGLHHAGVQGKNHSVSMQQTDPQE